MMNRRAFVIGLGAVLAAALAAGAQQPGKVWRIGYFSIGSRDTVIYAPGAFRQGLQQRGYIEGQNIVIEYRWEFGGEDRIPHLRSRASSTQPRSHFCVW